MYNAIKTLFIGMLLIAGSTSMAADSRIEPQLVRTLLQKSGMEKQITQMLPIMRMGMDQARERQPQLSQEQHEALIRSLSAFDASELLPVVQKRIETSLTNADAKAALAWLDSPLATKITAMEEAASTPEALADMQKAIANQPDNSIRVAKLKRLDQATKVTELSADMMMNAQIAVLTAMTAGLPPAQRPSVKDIKKQMDAHRAQIRTPLAEQTLASFLYTYRDLTDAEIDRYIAFAESRSGRKYHAALIGGMNDAMLQASTKMGAALSPLLTKQ